MLLEPARYGGETCNETRFTEHYYPSYELVLELLAEIGWTIVGGGEAAQVERQNQIKMYTIFLFKEGHFTVGRRVKSCTDGG